MSIGTIQAQGHIRLFLEKGSDYKGILHMKRGFKALIDLNHEVKLRL